MHCKGDQMVKVITIMDDVYKELYRLKRSKNMSFTEVLRMMLSQRQQQGKDLIGLAGSLEDSDIDRRTLYRLRSESNGKNLLR